MKHLKALAVFTIGFYSLSCFSQGHHKIEKKTNKELIHILNSSKQLSENSENYLSVRIYEIDNGSGSTGFPESHEVSYDLLIAVSAFDENPEQVVFEIGPFINPKFLRWTNTSGYSKDFEVEFGPVSRRESIRLMVDLKNLTPKK